MVSISENVLKMPAYELTQLIRNHEITSVDLINLALDKIEQDNSKLNAVITTRRSAAVSEAQALVDTGQPFFGVPLLIKGLGQSLSGASSTNGNKLFRNNIASETDNFVKALQAAGFIIIGQTNFPEFGFKNITDAQIYGPAHNPWNLDYQPGGSSGGSTAALADHMVPLASASDGGGSFRIPASWSGVIGLKPTRGRVPNGPSDWRSWQGAAINFAVTTNVKDTAILLDAMQIVQPAAVFQVPLNPTGFNNELAKPLQPLTVGYTTKSPIGTPVNPEAVTAVKNAVNFLESQGIATQEIDLPTDGTYLMETYYAMNAAETASMFDEIERATGHTVVQDDMEDLAWALYQTGKNISAVQYTQALSAWDHAAYQMDQLHQSYRAILTPTTADTAPRIDEPLVSPEDMERMRHITDYTPDEQQQIIWDQWLPSLIRSPFTQQANLTGNPAISLPTHITNTGLPLGIQFEAGKGEEGLLLQIAQLFEKEGQFKMRG